MTLAHNLNLKRFCPMLVRKSLKIFIAGTIKPLVTAYLKKDRNYNYKGIKLIVFKGVFHPGLFYSTKILLQYIKQFDLKGKTVLELGAGTGLISVYAAKKGALVLATDISRLSVENVKTNAEKNDILLSVLHSDLFKNIAPAKFDFIIINPPFYKKRPETEADFAWCCGEHSEYFVKFFRDLPGFIQRDSKVIIVLSEDCGMEEIRFLAGKNNLTLNPGKEYFRLCEKLYVFEITLHHH